VLGRPSESIIRRFFGLIIEESNIDLIHVGEVFIDSPLHRAITGLHNGILAWRERKEQFCWLIRLPASFDEYLASLRSTTRAAVKSERRRLEKVVPEFRVVQFPEDVELFLQEAEKISRLTYQWNLVYKFCNDDATRQKFVRLAKNGNLRCYLLYLGGNPVAFSYGELSLGKFVWYVTGYDPQYGKLSPGTALLMWMIRDLIENTDCEVFDFLLGRAEGYKSRFATTSYRCAAMEVAQIYRPYSLLLIALDQIFNLFKNLVESLLHPLFGRRVLGKRLRSAMHRYGIGTY
jgi:CelD/BcsL family acetyltransferase involved in cellulose biosynthesis